VLKIAFVDEKADAIFFVFLTEYHYLEVIFLLDGYFLVFAKNRYNYIDYQKVSENNYLQYSHICSKLGLWA